MYWAVYCVDKPNMNDQRIKFVDAHRRYLEGWSSKVVFSGPFQSDDASQELGSLIIFKLDSRAEAQAFIDGEPFYQAGIFEKVIIYRWRGGRFNPKLVSEVGWARVTGAAPQ